MRLRLSAALLFAFQLLGQPTFAAVQLVAPVPGQVNLGTLVTATGNLSLPSPTTPQGPSDVNSLPRLLPLSDPVVRLAAIGESATHLFDSVGRVLVGSVVGARIGGIAPVPGQSDLLLVEASGGHETLVRRERTTGREVWRADLGNGFVTEMMRTVSGFQSVTTIVTGTPVVMAWNAANQRVSLLGLELAAKQKVLADLIYTNRLVSIDWNTGAITSDERFDFDREDGSGRRVLVKVNRDAKAKSTGGGSLKVIESSTGNEVMSGQLESGDLPLKYDEMDARGGSFKWDYRPLWVGSELWICARQIRFQQGREELHDTWTRFDSQGRRLGRIDPSPRTATDFLVRNVGSTQWPKLFARVNSTVKCGGLACVEAVLSLAEDGSFSSRPLKLGDGGWPHQISFHDGDQVYFLHNGGLFRSVPGEQSATLIVPPPSDDKYQRIPLVRGGFALLVGEKTSTVVNYREGSTAPRSGEGAQGAEHLWSLGEGLIHIKEGPPSAGLPPVFDRYEDGVSRNSLGTVWDYACWNCPKLRGMCIWSENEAGDVILVPGLLKTGQAILVGVEWPANRVAFWLPIARLKGLVDQEPPGGSPFPYVVFSRDAVEAGLAVLEDTNRITLYAIRRPGTAVRPRQP